MNAPTAHRPEPNRAALHELAALLGDRFSDAKALCARPGHDESYHAPCPPDAVAFPRSTEDVAAIVKLCNKHRVPMIAYGVGTSLEGNIAAIHGGICLDMGQMNHVIEVNA